MDGDSERGAGMEGTTLSQLLAAPSAPGSKLQLQVSWSAIAFLTVESHVRCCHIRPAGLFPASPRQGLGDSKAWEMPACLGDGGLCMDLASKMRYGTRSLTVMDAGPCCAACTSQILTSRKDVDGSIKVRALYESLPQHQFGFSVRLTVPAPTAIP